MAAVALAAISAIGMIATQSAASGRSVADATEAGQFGPVIVVGLAVLLMFCVVMGMIITAVVAGRVQRVGTRPVLVRCLLIMSGGLAASFIVWMAVVTGWALTQ